MTMSSPSAARSSSPRTSLVTRLVAAAAIGAVTLSMGCAGVRVVHRNQAGGTLALQGFQDKAMEAAHRTMAAHCGPGNYTIVSEGEEVIGSVTTGSASTSTNKKKTVTVASGSSETTNKTEQRLQYQCNQYLGQYVAPPTAASFAAGQQPPQPAPPPGQPYAIPGQPYAAPAQPYPPQPYPPQPAPGQPYAQPAYYQPVPQPGAPYPAQPYPPQPYPPQAPPPAPAAPR